MIKAFLVKTARLLICLFGTTWRRRVSNLLREAMSSHGVDAVIREEKTSRGRIRFYCLGDLALWRAETLLTKEPETIEWIDGMDDGDVLFDIGANVGVYTLYAAINRKVRVLAFEPLAANYYLLNRNIEENGLSDMAASYCVAINDSDMISTLHIQDTGFGTAMSSFDDPVDHHGKQFSAMFEQGMIGMSLDSFIEIFEAPFPSHIKIDVDGIENKIVRGAQRTLSDPRLKSVSIELDEGRPKLTDNVIAMMADAGLDLARKSHSPMFDGTPYASIFNYQFCRELKRDI